MSVLSFGQKNLMLSDRLAWARWRLYEGWNYRLRTLAGGRLAWRCRPVSAILLLTENCNAKCVHCDIWKNRLKEDVTLEEWRRVLTDLRAWLGRAQVLITGGEALMKPFTIELVRQAHELGLFLELLTHGYWEDQKKIERLALARPWKVTMSLDGLGEIHTKVRGRPAFWERSLRTLETLKRMRREHRLGYAIRLKNVIMSHNLEDTIKLAKFAEQEGVEIFYQPIEQNYNTPEDAQWYLHSENWPRDTELATARVRELIALKKSGRSHIANSVRQLEAMIRYFENPDASRVAIQTHSAHERRRSCNALIMLQVQSNGDVTVCTGTAPVGNIRERPIREIWESRPRLWEEGCCLERRCSEAELVAIEPAPSLAASDAWRRR
jgi:MoaA/NifB/PqqE/SkfB family radical SAM enzyme